MAQHRLNHKGLVTTGPMDGTSTAIFEGHVSFSNPPTTPSKYQILRDHAPKIFQGADVHFLFALSGANINTGSTDSW